MAIRPEFEVGEERFVQRGGNQALFWATGLAALTAGVHLFAGTPEVTRVLLQSALPPEIRLILYACWHFVTVTLAISAAGFFIGARSLDGLASYQMVRLLSWLWIAFGVIILAVALTFGGASMLVKLPQWTILLPTGALGLWGSRKPPG